MAFLMAILLASAAGPGLGIRGSLAMEPGAAAHEAADSEGAGPVLLPAMPMESTARLRRLHPLLEDLAAIARPIRETLRSVSLWNVRPDYRNGEFCLSWELNFSL
jgi:hypothetical protein